MSFSCAHCGYKSSDIKSMGTASPNGKIIRLFVQHAADLGRDLLKSDTAALAIPEIELSLAAGTLGGRFTTVEGILTTIRDELRGSSFLNGDGADAALREKWEEFFQKLEDAIHLKFPFHLVLDDPMSNSYVQNLGDSAADSAVEAEEYQRKSEDALS